MMKSIEQSYSEYIDKLDRVRPDDGKPEPVAGNIFHEPSKEIYKEIQENRKRRIEISKSETPLSEKELEELRKQLF